MEREKEVVGCRRMKARWLAVERYPPTSSTSLSNPVNQLKKSRTSRNLGKTAEKRTCRGKGTFRSLRGHRPRKKAAGLEKDEERALDLTLMGGRRMGGGG